jgi:hypothetical protein
MNARIQNMHELAQAGIGLDDCVDLQAISRTLHALDEHSCNGYYSERAEKAAETRESNLEKRAESIAQKYNLHAYHQSDPRGWSLYLITPEMNDSNYSRGVAVCPH